MTATLQIAVLVGSLRKGSITRKVAQALIRSAPQHLHCEILEIGDLPLYNADLDDAPPRAWLRFREEIAAKDAILFVTPEYNRSIPGCLKNALDVGSRPEGKNAFDAMPAGVVSVTPYKMGAFGANHALRQTLVFLNMPVMQQPEAYIGSAGDLFGDDGVADEATGRFLTKFMAGLATWIETVTMSPRDGAFSEFMKRRVEAATAYVVGNSKPLDEITVKDGAATFFPPGGGAVSGARTVSDRYDSDAHAFSPGGSSKLDVLQSGASGEYAFWTGFQDATAKMVGQDQPIRMKLRITEIFRRSGEQWQLAHRHADMLGESHKK